MAISSTASSVIVDDFIERWSRAEASERANAQLFLSDSRLFYGETELSLVA